MKRKSVFALLLALFIAFTGCKKSEDIPAIKYKSQGFIKGIITGKTSTNKELNEKFSFSEYNIQFDERYGANYEIDSNSANKLYNFVIERSDFSTGGTAKIQFTIDSPTSTSPLSSEMGVLYSKETGNEVLSFNMSSGEIATVQITNFSFDEKTGRVKGSYLLAGESASSEKAAKVEGNFDVIAKKVVR